MMTSDPSPLVFIPNNMMMPHKNGLQPGPSSPSFELWGSPSRFPKVMAEFFAITNLPGKKMSAQCKLCGKTYKTVQGITSNLHRHMRKSHEEVYEEMKGGTESRKRRQPLFVKERDLPKFESDHQKQKQITEAILDFISASIISPSIVDTVPFQQLLTAAEPRFNVPNCKSLTSDLIGTLNTKVKPTIANELRNAPKGSVHILVEVWAAEREGFLCARSMHVNKEWELKKCNLGSKYFLGEIPAENKQAFLKTMLSEAGLNMEDVGYCVADVPRSIISATNMLHESSQSLLTEQILLHEDLYGLGATEGDLGLNCVVHELNLVVRDAFRSCPSATATLKQLGEAITFIRKSQDLTGKLLRSAGVDLSGDVWGSKSVLEIIRSISQEYAFTALRTLLTDMLSANTRCDLLELVALLRPFEEATNVLQGDGLTSPWVIPAIFGIDRALRDDKTERNAALRQILRDGLRKRFESVVHHKGYILSSLLDPRLKLSAFANGQAEPLQPVRLDAVLVLKAAVAEEKGGELDEEHKSDQQKQAQGPESSFYTGILSFLDSNREVHQTDSEVDKYMEEARSNENPLEYWRANERRLPRLAQLARKHMGIPVSCGGNMRLACRSGVAPDVVKAYMCQGGAEVKEALLTCKWCKGSEPSGS